MYWWLRFFVCATVVVITNTYILTTEQTILQEYVTDKFDTYESISAYQSMKYDVNVETYDDGKKVTFLQRDIPVILDRQTAYIFFITPDYQVTDKNGSKVK